MKDKTRDSSKILPLSKICVGANNFLQHNTDVLRPDLRAQSFLKHASFGTEGTDILASLPRNDTIFLQDFTVNSHRQMASLLEDKSPTTVNLINVYLFLSQNLQVCIRKCVQSDQISELVNCETHIIKICFIDTNTSKKKIVLNRVTNQRIF